MLYRCQACKRHFHVGSYWPDKRVIIASVALASALALGLLANLLTSNVADVEYQPAQASLDQTGTSKTQQAAEQGDASAQYELGRSHWHNAEYPKAFSWFKAAAKQGHIEAEYLLGMAYLSGRGTLQNYRAALESFTQAAERGHIEAEYQLGILYRDGLAMAPNKEAAYLWLNIAAARGHEEAVLMRNKLAAVMTSAEISRAQEASSQADARISAFSAAKP